MFKILVTLSALAVATVPATASTICYVAKNGARINIGHFPNTTSERLVFGPPARVIAPNGTVKECAFLLSGDDDGSQISCRGEAPAYLDDLTQPDGIRYKGVAYYLSRCRPEDEIPAPPLSK